MRPLMAAKIGELRVSLVAHVANERFHARVDMHVLFEARGRAELLAALGTRVSRVVGVDMVLRRLRSGCGGFHCGR